MRAALLALLLSAVPALAAADAAGAVDDFYAVYKSQQRNGGGIPDATARARYQAVLSPRLNKQMADAALAQARLTAKVKNAVPPMLEGDIFTSLFEGATGWKLNQCQGDARQARCSVTLTHTPLALPGQKAEKPVTWTDAVIVVATPQGWKVDDIAYDANFAFGNTGRLSGMLQMVVASNP